MITIIHGDDAVSSRNFFFLKKNKIENPVIFDRDNFDFTLFLQSLSGKSLFAEEKNIFLDNILSKMPADQLKKISFIVNKSQSPINIFIWEGTVLRKTFINQFPKADVKLFKLPQSLFSFLDAIRPGSSRNISLFHTALNASDANLLFSMIVRQFRLLLALRAGSLIEDAEKLSSWQRNKLLGQSKLFTIEELKRIYKKLYKLDLNIKTGVQSNLSSAIDFFLLDI